MKAYEARRKADGGDAPLLCEAADGCFAHLKDMGQLARRQKLVARFPVLGCSIAHRKIHPASKSYLVGGGSEITVR